MSKNINRAIRDLLLLWGPGLVMGVSIQLYSAMIILISVKNLSMLVNFGLFYLGGSAIIFTTIMASKEEFVEIIKRYKVEISNNKATEKENISTKLTYSYNNYETPYKDFVRKHW